MLQSWGSENQTPRLTPPWLSRNGRSSPRRRSEPLQRGRGPGRGQRTGQEAAALPGAASSPGHPPAGPPDSSTRDWTQSSRPGKEVGGANKRGGAPQPPSPPPEAASSAPAQTGTAKCAARGRRRRAAGRARPTRSGPGAAQGHGLPRVIARTDRGGRPGGGDIGEKLGSPRGLRATCLLSLRPENALRPAWDGTRRGPPAPGRRSSVTLRCGSRATVGTAATRRDPEPRGRARVAARAAPAERPPRSPAHGDLGQTRSPGSLRRKTCATRRMST